MCITYLFTQEKKLSKKYFAFSDTVENVGSDIFIRFDAITENECKNLINRNNFTDVDNELNPQLIELTVKKSFRVRNHIETGHWYEITLGYDGIPAFIYNVLHAGEATGETEQVFIEEIKFLDGRCQPARTLLRLVSLDTVPDTSAEILELAIFANRSTYSIPTHLAVYNVGQGSASAVCTVENHPIMYFDFGGGITCNAGTYPSNLKFCFSSKPPVVLSHWDLDHWVSGYRHKKALELKWITPRQRIGVTHRKFATQLQRNNNLLIWPDKLSLLATPYGTLYKLPPHRDRNYSGLVFVAEVGDPNAKIRVLCPGDAPYHRILQAATTNLTGLIATHHGGLYQNNLPPATPNKSSIVYSFGVGNSYQHPHRDAILQHIQQGWNLTRNTANGNTALPLPLILPRLPDCWGQICSLAIMQ